MSDLAPTRTPVFEARLKKRYAAERRFRLAGLGVKVSAAEKRARTRQAAVLAGRKPE